MAQEPVKKKSGGLARALAVLLPLLAGLAIGLWFLLRSSSGESTAQAGPETHVQSTLHLDSFVLNLADADQRSYLRVGIDLGLNHELKRDEPVPVAQVRDAILAVLAEGKVDELMTPAGKTKLKENLLRTLKERVP
jgi:flagellar basal body-associated protein FliL